MYCIQGNLPNFSPVVYSLQILRLHLRLQSYYPQVSIAKSTRNEITSSTNIEFIVSFEIEDSSLHTQQKLCMYAVLRSSSKEIQN
jgi:hypothetical protein